MYQKLVIHKSQIEEIFKKHFNCDSVSLDDVEVDHLNISIEKKPNMNFVIAYNLLQYMIKIYSNQCIEKMSSGSYDEIMIKEDFKGYSGIKLTDESCENLASIFGADYLILRNFFPGVT